MHKAAPPIFPKLTEAQRNQVLFVHIPPSLSFVVLSDFVHYLTLHAESAGAQAMSIGWLVRPGAMEEPLFDARMAMNIIADSASPSTAARQAAPEPAAVD